MSKIKSFSFLFLSIVAFVLAGLLYSGYFVKSILTPISSNSTAMQFEIKKGDGVHQISQHLFERGLINSRWNFEVYIWMRKIGSRLQAGEYSIRQNISIRELADLLAAGKSATVDQPITIIEGWTINDIAQYLDKQGVVAKDDFIAAAKESKNFQNSVLADKPVAASLEGYLFPDTYRIYKGADSQDVILKMLQNLDSKLTPDLRAAMAARHLSVFKVIVMASILEKEVKHPTDLAIVSDIFWRRLESGKKLESDATLNYILQRNKPQLTAKDLLSTSPYNSYKYVGLPPGPISNPGLAAIKAAISPQPNNFWFFLSAPDGTTKFAITYQEHLRNKQLYLK